MTATEATILAYLRAAAERVSASHADLELAGADLRAAQATLLAKVLEAVRPAARSLGGRVSLGSVTSPAGTTSSPARWRGLYLDGAGPTLVDRELVEMPGYARASWPERGRYAGARLLMRDDGSLVELTYDGPWTNVPGEVSSWTAKATALSPREALDRGYKLVTLLETIGGAVLSQAQGKAPERAAQLRRQGGKVLELAMLAGDL